MKTDDDMGTSPASADIRFRTGNQPPPSQPSGCSSLTEDETRTRLLELAAQNAELLQTVDETRKILKVYKQMFDFASVGGIVLGRDGCIRSVNHFGAEILKSERSALVGLRLEQLVSDAGRPAFRDFIRKVMEEGLQTDCEVELAIDGSRLLIHFEGECSISGDECLIAMIGITGKEMLDAEEPSMRELTAELARTKQMCSQEIFRHTKWEETLNNSLKQQRVLASHLMTNREEERMTVAREIHDELGQMLASLQLNVALLTQEYPDHAPLVARARSMEQLITSSIMIVQRISSDLRPIMLDQLGLADAIEWQAQEFRKRSGIPCKTVIRFTRKKLDAGLSTAVYRIFQEALSNIIRHSGATCVRVDLMTRKRCLALSVCDDGRGITEREKKALLSLGIARMRERAEAFGGRLKICGSPRQGTLLFARIPLTEGEDHNAYKDTGGR